MNSKPEQNRRLEGKVAIVTGAAGGIGGATVDLFLREGARVTMVDRSADLLDAARAKRANDKNVAYAVAEATDEKAIAAAVTETIKTFSRVDILFANAGTEGLIKPIEEMSLSEFEQVFRTNVLGVWLAIKHCVGPMKKQNSGAIIATASVAGLIGYPFFAPYVASKHAVCGLVKTTALELGAHGIRVNGIAPGPIDNRMMQSLESQFSPQDPSAVRESLRAQTALKRYGANEEVANMAAFLASDAAMYCTGGIYTVDGGFCAG